MSRKKPLPRGFGAVIREAKKILKERPPPSHSEVRERIGRRIGELKNLTGLMLFLTTNEHFRDLYLYFGGSILEGLGVSSSEKGLGQTKEQEVRWLLPSGRDGLGHLIRLEIDGWRLTACDKYTPVGRVVSADEVRNPCRICTKVS